MVYYSWHGGNCNIYRLFIWEFICHSHILCRISHINIINIWCRQDLYTTIPTYNIRLPIKTHSVTLQNGIKWVHGFSYQFRNIQCLQYSATQNSCSFIYHQIISISPHSHNITTPHSFPLPTIICYFLYSISGAHGIQAQYPLETYKTHGKNSENNLR